MRDCTVIRLRLDDLERSATDPRLSALLREGWRIEADLALSEENGPPSWVLLLAPPRDVVEDRLALAVERRSARLAGAALGFALLGAAVAFLAIVA